MHKISISISLLIAVLLTVYIYLFEMPTQAEKENFSKYILNFEVNDLKEIAILNKGQPTITLTKDHKKWQLTKPFLCRANQELITSIAGLLPRLPKSNHVAVKDQKKLSEYGLEDPKLKVKVTYRDSLTGSDISRTLLFGSVTGAQNEVFVKAEDDRQIYLMHIQVAVQLSKDFNNFRDTKLVEETIDTLTKISIETPTEKWSMQKDNVIWQLVTPYTWKCNQEAVVTFLTNFTNLKINRFVENDLAKKESYSLNNPLIKISYTNRSNETTTLYIGATRANATFVHSTAEDFIFAVDSQELIKSLPTLQQLQDSILFTTQSPEIVQLDYNQGKEMFTFQKNIKQAWMVNQSNYPLDQQIISALVEQTTTLIPEYFIEGNIQTPDFGLNNENTIILNMVNIKGLKESLKIGSLAKGYVIPARLRYFSTLEAAKKFAKQHSLTEDSIQKIQEQYYATFNDYTQIFTIDADIIPKLKWPLIKFEPLEFPEVDLNAIFTIKRTIKDATEFYQRFGSNVNWEMLKPERVKLNSKEVALFIVTICNFKVKEWIKADLKETEFNTYGLDKPMLIIEATFNNVSETIKTGTYKYLISQNIKDEYYGCLYVSINNQDSVLVPKLFTVSKKMIEERLTKKLY